MIDQTNAKIQVALGTGIGTSPWWAEALGAVNNVAGTVAVVCGAIIGIHGVIKIWRNRDKGGA